MTLFGSDNYVLRPYQQEAVNKGLRFFKGPAKNNAIEVLPTGSGKSLIIANLVKELGAPTLVFQPSREILEQNYAKLTSYGYHASIFSASMGQRDRSKITFATIGSTINQKELFRAYRYIIVDECHWVNAKGGMYRDFVKSLAGVKVLGFTATPYRLSKDGYGGSILKFLTRTRPRVFHDLIYYVQNRDLFDAGYLAKLQYVSGSAFDRSKLQLNSTGADFTDLSVQQYYRASHFPDRLVDIVNHEMKTRRNALVFTRFVNEAEYVASKIPGAEIVTSLTPKKQRERVVNGFKTGKIPVVCNVGVLATGFDYPALETIVLARPTMSLALYYQMIGRGIRPHPKKEFTRIVDMCNNMSLFGKVEDMKICDGENGKWYISNGRRRLTNVYLGEMHT